MKRRLLALFTLFALALSLAPAALASQALGWELVQERTDLGAGVTVTSRTLWGDSKQDYRTEQYAVYTPGQGSVPVVYYGGTVPSTASVTAMAQAIESWGNRVLAGANGDYFVMATGVPLGMVVTDGVLRTSPSYHYAVGFRADGTAFVGKPEMGLWLDFHGYHLVAPGGYNKTRGTAGYYLYSSDFGAATGAKGSGINVILRPVALPEDAQPPQKPEPFTLPQPGEAPAEPQAPAREEFETEEVFQSALGLWQIAHDQWQADLAAWQLEQDAYLAAQAAWQQSMEQWRQDTLYWSWGLESASAQLTVGGSLPCVVESVVDCVGSVDIPQDRLVLSLDRGNTDFLVNETLSLIPGEVVTVSTQVDDSRWTEAVSAIGAFAQLIQDGVVPSGLEQTASPRTALGVKPDGQVILYTIDGRQAGHSVGASATQVANRLLELGCDQAVLFDGGGSTTFGATGALGDRFTLQNRPSDGSQRHVTNGLFFVSTLAPTGTLGSLYIQPHKALMLSGARQELSCLAIDSGGYPLAGQSVEGVSYSAEGPGSVEGWVFTAGAERGEAVLTAQAGEATGTAVFSVVDTPHTITVSDAATGQAVTSLSLDPGQSVDLTAAATWYKLPLLSDDTCFTWTVTAEVGTVDGQGMLTAGPRAASGSLTVSAGEKSVSIPIAVGGHIYALEPWEDLDHLAPLPEDGSLQAQLTKEHVRYGHSALEVSYPSWQTSDLTFDLPIAEGESVLGLWLDTAGGAPALEFQLLLADGQTQSVSASPEAIEGWQQVHVPIPEDAVALTGLRITPEPYTDQAPDGMAVPGGVSIGALYLDHFTTSNGPLHDTTPPTAKLTYANGALTARLSDNVDKTFRAEALSLTLDGRELEFTLDGSVLTAQAATNDGHMHRISLTVADASGNLARSSVQVDAADILPAPGGQGSMPPIPCFTDTAGHWAADYAEYLCTQGVTNGRQSPDGTFVFDPQANITRGEFATMLARWLRADLSGYDLSGLPFADAADIPAWAAPAVGYLYDTGVMTGSLEPDGLYAQAGQPITRAQAMTMLGRVQARGYAVQDAPFADDAEIPDWARSYVYTLAGQGVVSGFEGFLRPLDSITRCEVAKLLTTLW